MPRGALFTFLLLVPVAALAELPAPASHAVDFAKEIKPIIEARCVACHGPGKQKGGLRLDQREAAMKGGDSGAAIVPKSGKDSLLVKNIGRVGDATPMPPSGDPLTDEQIGLFIAWIDQGANWPDGVGAAASDDAAHHDARLDHWSFKRPMHPDAPAVSDTAWARNPIDAFILARLDKENLKPSPEADRITQARRLHLDLLGLPPSPEAVDAFAADASPDAYEQLVDRLLASPHFGERWGKRWLDAARYADTNGYEKDRERSIWPYRDWVIRAINEDKPFDIFTIEQIAGDMLPNATEAQRIATGFHRNTMVNEEGGIDVEQFRFESVVDRVLTTGQVFLGLTLNCAQCHDHKYDPVSQREYYQFFALLNNADEPELPVHDEAIAAKRNEILGKADAQEVSLAAEFPPFQEDWIWTPLKPETYKTGSASFLKRNDDQSLNAVGFNPQFDTYTIEFNSSEAIESLRVEAIADGTLPRNGPGRSENGNFVIGEIRAELIGDGGTAQLLEFARAEADFEQKDFSVKAAIDGDPNTGWAIADPGGKTNQNRAARFFLKAPLDASPRRLRVTLDQHAVAKHNLGRFRIDAGNRVRSHHRPELADADQRARHLEDKFAVWEAASREKARPWVFLDPASFVSENHSTLTKLADLSIFVSGDKPNRDATTFEFAPEMRGITALRIEALTDPSLPANGPGRTDVYGVGNFMLNEITIETQSAGSTDWHKIEPKQATADFSDGTHLPAHSIDGVNDTGWSVTGGEGSPHALVLELKEPLDITGGAKLRLMLQQHYIHQLTLGRMRISATSGTVPVVASGVPAAAEEALLKPAPERTAEDKAELTRQYLAVAAEVAEPRRKIKELRASAPKFNTTLVMQDRTVDPRKTQMHIRGDFLRPGKDVEPGVPAFLPPLPDGMPPNRLALAKWIVDERNPLTSRVVMNNVWGALMGRGLVQTAEDFGLRCEPPSHPELLDWLATEFIARGWSMKQMIRLIVTSATYRQASTVTPALLERDPLNVLLARGPRFRVEGEIVRDIALSASGLLVDKIGGPSVRPPQPPGVTELAYGSPPWNESTGEDRYRRGLYTFLKRATPYPAFITFDAPAGDRSCTRRMRSNTPLQSLTLMNDKVFIEAAQAMALRVIKESADGEEARARRAFRLCLARDPKPLELEKITAFARRQRTSFNGAKEDAAKLALADPAKSPEGVDIADLAAWTAVTRALLNLDETMTRE